MRLPIPTGVATSALLAAAFLAPAAASRSRPSLPVGQAFQRNIVPQHILRSDLFKYVPNVLSKKANENFKRWITTHHTRPGPRSSASVSEWISDDAANTIWGGYEKGNLFTVTTYLTDCSSPEGMRVDRSGNLVVACTNSGKVNIYSAGNTTGPANTVYAEDSVVSGTTTYYYPSDAFEDVHGNVYATNLYGFACNATTCTYIPGSIAYWPANSANGSLPTSYITDTNSYEMYFGDIDVHGNCYVDGERTSSSIYVDELPKCASNSNTSLGITLHFPGGVYVVSPRNKKKTMLSVIDQGTYGANNSMLYVYALPYTGTPLFSELLPQNVHDTCDPVAGGFDKNERHIKIGDAGCHDADYGVVATNSWTQVFSANFLQPIDAAFVPSDK